MSKRVSDERDAATLSPAELRELSQLRAWHYEHRRAQLMAHLDASTATQSLPPPRIQLKPTLVNAYAYSFSQLVGDEPMDKVILKLLPETPYECAFEAQHLLSTMR